MPLARLHTKAVYQMFDLVKSSVDRALRTVGVFYYQGSEFRVTRYESWLYTILTITMSRHVTCLVTDTSTLPSLSKYMGQGHGIMGRRFPDGGLLRYRK